MIRTKFPNKPFPNKSGIYLITSSVNGKRYVGSAVSLKGRKKGHIKSLKKGDNSRYMQSHYNKHGNVLMFSILEFCVKKKLIEREQYYIDLLKPEFNIALIAGSTLGVKRTEEQKQKLRGENNPMYGKGFFGKDNPMYGKQASAETRKKMSDAHKNRNDYYWTGKYFPEEMKQKISEANKGEKNHFYGKKHSEKTKLKIQEFHLGTKASEETKQKMRETRNAFYKTEKGKRLIEELKKNNKGRTPWNKGKTLPDAVKEKIGKSVSGINNGMFGRKHSEETKQKMKDYWMNKRENIS